MRNPRAYMRLVLVTVALFAFCAFFAPAAEAGVFHDWRYREGDSPRTAFGGFTWLQKMEEDKEIWIPYEGEKDTNKSMLWFYESAWVTMSLQDKEHEGDGMLAEYLAEYVGAGLRDFRINDAIPMTLKAFLFNRFKKGSMDGDITPFKTFFNKYY